MHRSITQPNILLESKVKQLEEQNKIELSKFNENIKVQSEICKRLEHELDIIKSNHTKLDLQMLKEKNLHTKTTLLNETTEISSTTYIICILILILVILVI